MQNGRPGRRTVALKLRVKLAGHANKHPTPSMPAARSAYFTRRVKATFTSIK
jgi:hypothetical protein